MKVRKIEKSISVFKKKQRVSICIPRGIIESESPSGYDHQEKPVIL